ncbi:MAG: catalase/peroxidase HPI [Deltaproteobacteria bacterium]|nr:catalase/peroxidase HPI [Deltaproteobacteria bacterium]
MTDLQQQRGPARAAAALVLPFFLACASDTPPESPPAPTGESGGDVAVAHDGPTTNDDWWPNRLDLRVLQRHGLTGDPTDEDFDYAEAFAALDLDEVKADIEQVLTTSQDWWPADYGHYGGLMIRLSWHSAGTYRITDGRGGAGEGMIRFAPLNSWPDNVNLDKARRLLLPVKLKYGRALSWADLIVLSGTVALESMGFQTYGFGGGREDVYEPTDINWGPETEWLADERMSDDGIGHGLGATQMGLIYVNPEGPGGRPDPLEAARHIRMAFGRMAMNDEETVALIAGGHTLGKAHGAARPEGNVGAEPEAAGLEQQGLGWENSNGSGNAGDTITSGLEGAWTSSPARWSRQYFHNLFAYEWELTRSPAGAQQWTPVDGPENVPDAHDPETFHRPMMFTTDLALREDPEYGRISRRFYEHPEEFEAAFARAWYKLTHRDLGPHSRLVGSAVPDEPMIWQDPVPAVDHPLVDAADIAALKAKILASGLTIDQLVSTAWASASTYRETDMRGGANGARIRLAPQSGWAANEPEELARVLEVLGGIQTEFNSAQRGGKRISLADLIVLGGAAAIEKAAKDAGMEIEVPFAPGRTDATAEMTDAESFDVLEPQADGFRNYLPSGTEREALEGLVERADLLSLTAPEMTVLVGGLRVLGANHADTRHGVFTANPGQLTNDFFVTLMDMDVEWERRGDSLIYEARGREGGDVVRTGTAVDLLFGSNSQLRALAEVYAGADAKERFVRDFVAAWTKVMRLDRFDLR